MINNVIQYVDGCCGYIDDVIVLVIGGRYIHHISMKPLVYCHNPIDC